MQVNLLLPLLLVVCGQAQQGPDNLPGNRRGDLPPWPRGPGKSVAVDTAAACNCACALTAEVTMAYQTKYNACVGRGDRHRLYSTEAGRGRGLSRFTCQPLRPWLRVPLRTIRLLLYTRY